MKRHHSYAIALSARSSYPMSLDGLNPSVTCHFSSEMHGHKAAPTCGNLTGHCLRKELCAQHARGPCFRPAEKNMRLQRASLRFRLHCQLFHQPGIVDEISTFRLGLGQALPRETSSPGTYREGAVGEVRICISSAGQRPEVASRIPSFGRRFHFESSMPHLVRTATSP